jgi:hypothetical protein
MVSQLVKGVPVRVHNLHGTSKISQLQRQWLSDIYAALAHLITCWVVAHRTMTCHNEVTRFDIAMDNDGGTASSSTATSILLQYTETFRSCQEQLVLLVVRHRDEGQK